MPIVSVSICGREYQLACDDGQEEQLRYISQDLDDRVRAMARNVPQAAESMLFLLTALTMVDEINELQGHIKNLKQETTLMRREMHETPTGAGAERLQAMESSMAETLEDVARRIEHLAQRLELH